MHSPSRQSLLVSSGWLQAAGIVLIVGFFIMVCLRIYTYNHEPPIPATVKDRTDNVLFTRADILAGQSVS